VLRLVYCLVNYGFYGSGNSLQQLLEPLMNLLDGTRDLPFPSDRGLCQQLEFLNIITRSSE